MSLGNDLEKGLSLLNQSLADKECDTMTTLFYSSSREPLGDLCEGIKLTLQEWVLSLFSKINALMEKGISI